MNTLTGPTAPAAARGLAPDALLQALSDGGEIAFLDVREEGVYDANHILRAANAPLSRLELDAPRLLPRPGVRVVLCDENEELSQRAAVLLAASGYTDVSVLAGGIQAWTKAGLPLFDGIFVPSKAFGEIIEHQLDTPHISAHELTDLIAKGADVVIVDTRTAEEYASRTIPGAINVPGAEIVYRIDALAPSPDTLVVVACGGRTRSILGAQSLINAGVPHRVVSLTNGTQGWVRDGLSLEFGAARTVAPPSPTQGALARSRAEHVARHTGVQRISAARLAQFKAEQGKRALFLFDVRPAAEYESGHRPGWRNAPGGQLVQATDTFIGILNARVVLHDTESVRALMTASWLTQLGGYEIYVLDDDHAFPLQAGQEPLDLLAPRHRAAPWIEAGELQQALNEAPATHSFVVFEIENSLDFRKRHVPGAWFSTRVALPAHLGHAAKNAETLVLVSQDGVLASLAAAELAAASGRDVRWLLGGKAAWKKAGYTFASGGERVLTGEQDIRHGAWAYEGARQLAEIDRYLSWEIDLVRRFEADGDGRIKVVAVPAQV